MAQDTEHVVPARTLRHPATSYSEPCEDSAAQPPIAVHVGIVPDGCRAASVFSLASMSMGGYWPSHFEPRIRDMRAAGVQNCEMESGVLLTLAGLFGLRAGCICVVSDRTPWPGPSEIEIDRNMDACIEVATDALLRVVKS